MTVFTNFLRSLLLTIIFSFVAPMFLVGSVLLMLFIVGLIPGLQEVTQLIATHIMQFLTIFGTGSSLQGLLIICLTCSFVGVLFDTYAYYRCQILR
jgi:hypothetical protein